MSPANLDLFSEDKKGEFTWINSENLILTSNFSDQIEDATCSELMTYQPSPYNNNLDLNELLNVADSDSVQNGMNAC
jgi:hypothetical protein